jgi:hypothetical protein
MDVVSLQRSKYFSANTFQDGEKESSETRRHAAL